MTRVSAGGTRLAVLLGNTNCRIALMEGLELRESLVLPHADLSASSSVERVRRLCSGVSILEAGLCSVVPPREAEVTAMLQAAGIQLLRRVQPEQSAFFPTKYDSMDTMGADRYCGVLAAKERYGVPVMVVDCGTATTVNIVDEKGVFIGGAIAPGVETLLRSMHDHTAQLPSLVLPRTADLMMLLSGDPEFSGQRITEEMEKIGRGPAANEFSKRSEMKNSASVEKKTEEFAASIADLRTFIGSDTAGSMRAGSLHFTRFAVEGMKAAVNNHIGVETPLVLTGGNALILLAAGLSCDPQVHDEDLLFRGIILYLLFTTEPEYICVPSE